MPVVDREKERLIVERARQRGWNDEQIKSAVLQFRSQAGGGVTSGVQTQPSAPQQAVEPQENKPNLLQSIAKPFVRTLAAVPALAGGISNLAQGDVAGAREALTKQRNILGTPTTPIGIPEDPAKQAFQPGAANAAKDVLRFGADIGGTGAQIASYAAPASILTKGAGLGARVLGSAAAGSLGGALGSAGEAIADEKKPGQILGSTLSGAIGGGLIGGLIPPAGALASKVLKPIGNTIGRVGSEILGKTTGAGEAAINQVFSDPAVIKYTRRASGEGAEGLMKSALEDTRRGFDLMTSSNSKAYREAMERIKATPQDLSNAVSDVRSQIVREATEGFGIRFADGNKLNNLDFNASDVVEGTASVQRAFDRLFGEPISSIADLDRVKKSLGRIAAGAPNRSPAQALIYKMKDGISRALKEKVPGYAQEMSRFSEAADLADDIQKALSLGDKASTDTTLRKLMSTLRQNNELRKGFLETLGKTSGTDPVSKIAGVTLSPKMPRGLSGALTPTLSGIGIATHAITPASIAGILLFLASTSPRLVAEAVSLLGRVKGKTLPLFVKQGIRNLLIQAAQQQED